MSDPERLVAVAIVLIPLGVIWVLALFHIIARRSDLSIGWKGIWSAFVILIPYIGVLVYAFVRPTTRERGSRDNDPTATNDAINAMHGLVAEHDAGTITDDQFAAKKAALFGLGSP
ncbi:MAG: PLD nuclease N-terminal domain-containing protein [Actinomycetota bacterium]|nr:PLD nuclease N-terminal domain-containing protein [Actinomycetota bacterium]